MTCSRSITLWRKPQAGAPTVFHYYDSTDGTRSPRTLLRRLGTNQHYTLGHRYTFRAAHRVGGADADTLVYDTFGRVVSRTQANGTKTYVTYQGLSNGTAVPHNGTSQSRTEQKMP